MRAGYLDQDDRLRGSSWVVPNPAVELTAVREARDSDVANGSVSGPWDYWAYVSVADAASTLAQVEEVLAAVLSPLAEGRRPSELVDRLPGWFRDRCAAPYVPGKTPVLPGAPGAGAGPDAQDNAATAVRVARWSTYCTPAEPPAACRRPGRSTSTAGGPSRSRQRHRPPHRPPLRPLRP